MPRQHRLLELELGREEAGDRDPVGTERRQRARRAAELRGEPRASSRACARAVTTATSQPAAFEPERRRHRLLEERPRGHRRQPVRLGEPAHAAATPSSSSPISPSARRETSIAALSTMSWLVAPKWT